MITTIQLTNKLKEELAEYKSSKETYEDVIHNLLDYYKKDKIKMEEELKKSYLEMNKENLDINKEFEEINFETIENE